MTEIITLVLVLLAVFAAMWLINAFTFGRFTWKRAIVKYRGMEREIFYKLIKHVEIKFGGGKEWHCWYEIKDRTMNLDNLSGCEISVFLDKLGQVVCVNISRAFKKGEINPDSWLQRVVLNAPEPVKFESAYAFCNSVGSETERRQKLDSLMYPEKAIFQAIIDQLPKA